MNLRQFRPASRPEDGSAVTLCAVGGLIARPLRGFSYLPMAQVPFARCALSTQLDKVVGRGTCTRHALRLAAIAVGRWRSALAFFLCWWRYLPAMEPLPERLQHVGLFGKCLDPGSGASNDRLGIGTLAHQLDEQVMGDADLLRRLRPRPLPDRAQFAPRGINFRTNFRINFFFYFFFIGSSSGRAAGSGEGGGASASKASIMPGGASAPPPGWGGRASGGSALSPPSPEEEPLGSSGGVSLLEECDMGVAFSMSYFGAGKCDIRVVFSAGEGPIQ